MLGIISLDPGAYKSEEGRRKSLSRKDPPRRNLEAPSPGSSEAEPERGQTNQKESTRVDSASDLGLPRHK
jgi:hypothetical protein